MIIAVLAALVLASMLLLAIVRSRRRRNRTHAQQPETPETIKRQILRLLISHGPLDTSQLAVELIPDDEDAFLVLLDELCHEQRIEIRETNDDPWLIIWGMPTLRLRRRSA